MDMRNFYRRNLPVLLVLGIILALAGAGAAKQAAALPAGSWGLSFQQEGQPPVGNTTADRLRQYDAAFLGDTAQKRIYLTFDAGYENGCTAQILDALQKHHAPAAFFLVGNYIERNPRPAHGAGGAYGRQSHLPPLGHVDDRGNGAVPAGARVPRDALP